MVSNTYSVCTTLNSIIIYMFSQRVKTARHVIDPNPGFMSQLQRYEQELKKRREADWLTDAFLMIFILKPFHRPHSVDEEIANRWTNTVKSFCSLLSLQQLVCTWTLFSHLLLYFLTVMQEVRILKTRIN